MTVEFHKTFDKQFAKLSQKRRSSLIEAIDLFVDNPNDPSLRNHPLLGEWSGYRSISVGGDLRAHFQLINNNTAFFVAIGTHSQLYS